MDAKEFLTIGMRRLEMLRGQFLRCVKLTGDPLAFASETESLMQNIRNYTYYLQKNKTVFENFTNWYGPWRDKMRDDKIMKWLKDTRDSVVHTGKFSTGSHVELCINDDYAHEIKKEQFDIMLSDEEIIKRACEVAKHDHFYNHSTATIRRFYFYRIGEEDEDVLEVLAYGVQYMMRLFFNLTEHIAGEKFNLSFPEIKVPPQETMFKLRNGVIIHEALHKITGIDKSKLEEIRKQMGTLKTVRKVDAPSKIYQKYFETAKKLLMMDGHLESVVMLRSGKTGGWKAVSCIFRDRAEKILFWHKLAEMIEHDKVDMIVSINECWVINNPKKLFGQIRNGKEVSRLHNKREAFCVDLLSANGDRMGKIVFFRHDGKKIVFEEEIEHRGEEFNIGIYSEILARWGLADDGTLRTDKSHDFDNVLNSAQK